MDRQLLHRPIAYVFFIAALSASPALLAGPIDTWQGARAEVDANGQLASQQGSVAEADAAGEADIGSYYRNDASLRYISIIKERSTARAEVLGTPDTLLRVSMQTSIDVPGTLPWYQGISESASAKASWIGERIHVAANDPASLPDSVRLGVQVELADVWSQPTHDSSSKFTPGGAVDLRLGGRLIRVSDRHRLYSSSDFSLRLVRSGFDVAERVSTPDDPDGSRYRALALLDLAIDDQGWSDPFDLSLRSSAHLQLEGNGAF